MRKLKVKKPKRGRKSPRGLSIWEDKFSRKLKKHHKSATYKEAVREAAKRTEQFWKKSLH